MLANIYFHYVLVLWFEKRCVKSCRGKASLARFADDFVACFQREDDARRFLIKLKDRLTSLDLEAAPTKMMGERPSASEYRRS